MPEENVSNAQLMAYIINLKSAKERKKHMQQVSSVFDIELDFFSAYTPSSLPEKWHGYFYDEKGKPWADLKPGEIACYASHLELMSYAVRYNIPVLIAEDDLKPLVDKININDLLTCLPSDWGFLRLSGNLKSPALVRRKKDSLLIVETTRQPNNMGLYVVSPEGARCFIEYSKKRFRAIDEDLRCTWEHGAVNYCVANKLVEINIFDSNIDAEGKRDDIPERKRIRSIGPSALVLFAHKCRWTLKRFGINKSLKILLNLMCNKCQHKTKRKWIVE